MCIAKKAISVAAAPNLAMLALMLLSLSLATADEPKKSPSVVLGTRTFRIPFNVNATPSTTTSVRLYVRRGPNQPWQLADTKPSSIREFAFVCKDDGEFWFATETIELPQAADDDVAVGGSVDAQLRVLVDTTKPVIDLQADAEADGTIACRLSIRDLTAITETRVYYATDVDSQWQDWAPKPGETAERFSFLPDHDWRQLSVHVRAVDSAGNHATATKQLQRPRMAVTAMPTFAIRVERSRGRVGSTNSAGIVATPVQYRIHTGSDLYVRPALSDPNDTSTSPVIKLDRYKTSAVEESETSLYRTADYNVPHVAANPLSRLRGTNLADFSRVPANAQRPGTVPPTPPSYQFSAVPRYTASSSAVELPPPATAEQVGNGFGLNPPQVSPGYQTPSFSPNALASPLPPVAIPNASASAEPSTAPYVVPSLNPTASAVPSTQAARPQSAAEAMRPLDNARPIRPAPPVSRSPYVTPATRLPESSPSPDPRTRYGANRPASSPPKSLDPTLFAERVPTRYSNSNRFSLEYELEAVGSRGVDSVELYGSTDGGQTWKLWGQDPDKLSPFDIETKEEGVFGFCIVVVSSTGLASPRPLAGEDPDIVVVVDKSAPQVRITGAQYGEGDRVGSLVIRYECADANLMARPITLSFSDRVDGPWTTIAAGLRNQGDHVWPADPRLPRQLYLRIDATDGAGNMGSYVLDRPIDAQGLAPRARIRGFQPISGFAPPAENEQTAGRPRATFK
ncbi:hypothetical protein [Novipirellula artificiosorum]|uniref:Ser-Thr-rich glycosyl-phosphatidyl-inositol-anchored membrane family protein n=1 Tax=Novipirellula artificiosorum TaxID=2528016 RepID=A0A5C6DZM7_9BACT|nr:hypothetical protein [Novipirellula artificiosorum]TWU42070.1 hypothetical protein Poly41_03660 [Novipirellula artificiosorum]